MNKNEKYFYIVDYKISLLLKEHGFDEPCEDYYRDGELMLDKSGYCDSYDKMHYILNGNCLAPNYTQITEWYEHNHDIILHTIYDRIYDKYSFYIEEKSTSKILIDFRYKELYLNRFTALNNAIIEAFKIIGDVDTTKHYSDETLIDWMDNWLEYYRKYGESHYSDTKECKLVEIYYDKILTRVLDEVADDIFNNSENEFYTTKQEDDFIENISERISGIY